jgi:hypothetical protein
MANSSQITSAEQSPFKLPRSSYNELVKIIMAYGKVNKPASLDEISQYCGVGRISVSSNNAFLSAVGVIEGGKAKIINSASLRFIHRDDMEAEGYGAYLNQVEEVQ